MRQWRQTKTATQENQVWSYEPSISDKQQSTTCTYKNMIHTLACCFCSCCDPFGHFLIHCRRRCAILFLFLLPCCSCFLLLLSPLLSISFALIYPIDLLLFMVDCLHSCTTLSCLVLFFVLSVIVFIMVNGCLASLSCRRINLIG